MEGSAERKKGEACREEEMRWKRVDGGEGEGGKKRRRRGRAY